MSRREMVGTFLIIVALCALAWGSMWLLVQAQQAGYLGGVDCCRLVR